MIVSNAELKKQPRVIDFFQPGVWNECCSYECHSNEAPHIQSCMHPCGVAVIFIFILPLFFVFILQMAMMTAQLK